MTENTHLDDDSKATKLNKFLCCGLEDGGTYQLKTSEFNPIKGFEAIINEFNNLYSTESDSLFTIHGTDSIIVVANTYTLTLKLADDKIRDAIKDYEISDEKFEKYFKDLGVTDKVIEILKEMWDSEEWLVATIIESIAKAGQTINISCTDTLYGNTEYDLTTQMNLNLF